MSSETSTDVPSLASGTGQVRAADAGFQVWQLFTLAALISASAIAFLARDRPSSVRVALILTVFGAAVVGVAAFRALLPLTRKGAVFSEPASIGGRTRVALEREKTLALRTIKELEFDRAMGKVSDKDFAEMSARLRARAARILTQLDASPYRDQIQREIAQRLGSAASARPIPAGTPPPLADDSHASVASEPAVVQAAAHAAGDCTECGTGNDADARFCKACGHRLDISNGQRRHE